ncbi:MAG: hypothetical protein JJ866_26665, partial [Roseibium sp.]
MPIFSSFFRLNSDNTVQKSGTRLKPLTLVALLTGGLLATQAAAQEKSIVTIDDADFFGSDIRTVKDVDLEGCKSACLKDSRCRAFTFNTSAGWCFLKADFGELQSFVGAVAGRVVVKKAPREDRSAERRAELTFLPQSRLENARIYADGIANTGRRTGLTAEEV